MTKSQIREEIPGSDLLKILKLGSNSQNWENSPDSPGTEWRDSLHTTKANHDRSYWLTR